MVNSIRRFHLLVCRKHNLAVYPFHHIGCFHRDPLQHYCFISQWNSSYIKCATDIVQPDYLGNVSYKRYLQQIIINCKLIYYEPTFFI